jgi:hypothetical protein
MLATCLCLHIKCCNNYSFYCDVFT